jgi:hypothetical protein
MISRLRQRLPAGVDRLPSPVRRVFRNRRLFDRPEGDVQPQDLHALAQSSSVGRRARTSADFSTALKAIALRGDRNRLLPREYAAMAVNLIGLGLIVAGIIFLIYGGVVLWILGTICLIGGVGALFMTWQRRRREAI